MNKYLTMNQQGTLSYVSLNQDNSLTYDYPILSDTLNPAVWNVVKLLGWNSNPDYLTKLEAAAVTSFPDNMFDGNTDITSFNELVYFTSLTELPDYCFCNCPNLVEVTLPPSVKTLGRACFCIRNANWNYDTYYSHLRHIYNFEQLENFKGNCLQYCFNLSLNTDSFKNFKTSFLEGYSVMSLSSYKTVNGEYLPPLNLKQLYLPNAEFIECQTFFRIISLEEIYIGNNCTTIRLYAFGLQAAPYNAGYKPNIKKIDIGTGLTTIEGKFVNLSELLKTVIIRAVTPPTLVQVEGAYYPTANNNEYRIYVPDASVDAYKAATGWSTLADKILPLSLIEN